MPPLTVSLATPDDRPALQRMLELYQHDLSDLWPQELDAQGEYGYELDRYFTGADAWPHVARVDGHYAGFALVDRRVRVPGDEFWMDQFFVLRRHRRHGVGGRLAVAVFQAHPGRWQVGQMPANLPAQAFWCRVIGEHTQGDFRDQVLETGPWQGRIQRFVSHAAS